MNDLAEAIVSQLRLNDGALGMTAVQGFTGKYLSVTPVSKDGMVSYDVRMFHEFYEMNEPGNIQGVNFSTAEDAAYFMALNAASTFGENKTYLHFVEIHNPKEGYGKFYIDLKNGSEDLAKVLKTLSTMRPLQFEKPE